MKKWYVFFLAPILCQCALVEPDLSIYKKPLPIQILNEREISEQDEKITSILKQVVSTFKACANSGGGLVGSIGIIPYLDSAKTFGSACSEYKKERTESAFELAQMVWPELIGSGSEEALGRIERFKKMLPNSIDRKGLAEKKIAETFAVMHARLRTESDS